MTQPLPRVPMLAEPWGNVAPRPCPVCDRWWQPWKGSILPCHARCLFSRDELVRLHTIASQPEVRLGEMARWMGISLATLRGVLRIARSEASDRRVG